MLLVATSTGKVGHIVNSVFTGADGRVITTVCGKTYDESELGTADGFDACSACDKKFNNIVEDEPSLVASDDEVEAVADEPEPKAETSKKK